MRLPRSPPAKLLLPVTVFAHNSFVDTARPRRQASSPPVRYLGSFASGFYRLGLSTMWPSAYAIRPGAPAHHIRPVSAILQTSRLPPAPLPFRLRPLVGSNVAAPC